MTNEELDRLKELAERATPGPWHRGRALEPTLWTTDMKARIACDTEQDARYIAAVSPDVALKLIAEVKDAWNLRTDAQIERGFLKKENESLHAENERLKGARTCPACFQTIARDQDIEVVLSLQSQLAEAREVISQIRLATDSRMESRIYSLRNLARAYLEKYK